MRAISLSKSSKYRNRKTRMGGLMFDSKLEAERWLVLRDKEQKKEIAGLVRQMPFDLYAAGEDHASQPVKICIYKPDFQYVQNGKIVAEDSKGAVTALFSLKAKIFRANYPHIELRIIKAKDVAS